MQSNRNVAIKRGVLFSWFSPILATGNEETLELDDLPPLPQDFDAFNAARSFVTSAGSIIDGLSKTWMAVGDVPVANIKPLVSSIFQCHCFSLLKITFLKALGCLLSFLSPLIMGEMVSYLDGQGQRQGLLWGFYLVAGLTVISLLSAVINTNSNARSLDIRFKIQSSLSYIVYYRSTLLPLAAWQDLQFSEAQVNNFLQVDVDQVASCLQNINDLWLLPLQIIIAFVLLYFQIQIAFIAGVVVIVVMIPINSYIAKQIGSNTSLLMTEKDARMRLIMEALRNFTSMKLSGLEEYLLRQGNHYRSRELIYLSRRKYLDAWCVFLWAFTPILVPFSTFTTAIILEQELAASRVIVTLSLLNMLIFPMNAFPWVINGFMEARVSIRRLARLLNSRDNERLNLFIGFTRQAEGGHIVMDLTTPPRHCFKKAVHSYKPLPQPDNDSAYHVGLESDWECKGGKLYGIVGLTGSGKTSLLLGLLDELHSYCEENDGVELSYSISQSSYSSLPAIQLIGDKIPVNMKEMASAYCAQSPALFSGTIRSNIMIGQECDEKRYRLVLKGCGLDRDLQLWEHGDLKEVGSQGSALSTGQILRLGIARALYSTCTLVILDDPFSALDQETASNLMSFIENYTVNIEKRIVIIATHHLHLLSSFHEIIVLSNGKEIERGSHKILSSSLSTFQSLLSQEHALLSPSSNKFGEGSNELREEQNNLLPESGNEDLENKQAGVISNQVIIRYFKAMGYAAFVFLLISLVLMQLSSIALLNFYTYSSTHNISNDTSQFLYISSAIVAINLLFTLVRSFLFAYNGIRASTFIYNDLARAVFRADMIEFETKPIGQISNRLGKDTNTVDDSLPFIMNILLAQCVMLLGSVLVIIYSDVIILLLLAIICYVYYYLQKYYRNVSRELKRLESIYKSPVYTFYLESMQNNILLHNLSSASQSYFSNTLLNKLNVSLRISLFSSIASQYLNIRLQLLSVLLTSSLGASLILNYYYNILPSSAGVAGLALLYSNSIINNLNGFVNAFVETEQEFVAVERIYEYSSLTPDPALKNNKKNIDDKTHRHCCKMCCCRCCIKDGKASRKWYGNVAEDDNEEEDIEASSRNSYKANSLIDFADDKASAVRSPLLSDPTSFQGANNYPARKGHRFFSPATGASASSDRGLVITDLCLRYPPSLAFVLQQLSLQIEPRSRVAIVGRTGCGKTSLLRCLLRINDFEQGSIYLGGHNLRDIENMRGKVSVIPQKAFVFEGNVFENVKVRSYITAGRVWRVLVGSEELYALMLSFFDVYNNQNIDFTALDQLRDAIQQDSCYTEYASSNHANIISDELLRLLSYKTSVHGGNLSQGQRMLISVLRAILVDSDFVLVDELTASLDSVTTVIVYNALRRYCEERPGSILLLICHKLQDIEVLCNKLLRLQDGKVVSFEDLGSLETL